MKKILLYSDTPIAGGAEIQMFLLAKFLDKNKFQPILACSNFPQLNRWCENFEKEGIKVIRLKVKHKHDPRHYFQLRKIIKEEKIDILHLHVWNPASCRYGFLAGKSRKIPIIITEHDPFEISKFKTWFKSYTLESVKKIIAISDSSKNDLEKLYPAFKKKIEVIHNGIDTVWWHSQNLRFTEDDLEDIKENLFEAKKDTLIITSIAALHERKGLKYLIQAISNLVKEFPNIKLVIVGQGPQEKELKELIKELKIENHIKLLGQQKETPKILKSTDIFVLPSKREAFGLVNLEAMITGMPIVASKVGGIQEVVKDGETGILIEPKISDVLARALKLLIESPEKRVSMAAAGQKRVQEFFTAGKMAKEYEKEYEEIST